jgi:hypothetical protein
MRRGCPSDTTCVPDNNKNNSSTHKQATDNPAAGGVFFACVFRGPGRDQVAGVVVFTVRVKVVACITDPEVAVTVTVVDVGVVVVAPPDDGSPVLV